MKLTNLTSAAAAFAFAALLGTSARAASPGSADNLIIGFDQSGNANYEVNLGSVSQFLNPLAATQTFNLSDADLDSFFGSNWATVTTTQTTNAVQWGLIGANNSTGTQTFGLSVVPVNTLFESQNTWAGVPLSQTSSKQGATVTDIKLLYNGNAQVAATAGSTVALPAYTVGNGNADGFDTLVKNNFGAGGGVPKSELDYNSDQTLAAADALTLNLYELVPTATGTASGTLLGTFTLTNNGTSGVLTFTAAPEPSTYLLMAVSGLVLVWRLRRNASVA